MNQKTQTDNVTLILMIIFHALAFIGLFMPTTGGVIAFVIFYAITVLGITVGFHRYFTHQSFKANIWVRRALAVAGSLALQGNIREWVAHHRMHHAGSDTSKDPHDASQGFWFSHILWLFKIVPEFDDVKIQNKFARDIINDPFLNWLCRPIVFIGMQVVLGIILWAAFSFEVMMWGIWVRLIAVYHVTWFVNSVCHTFGYKNFPIGDRSVNNWWVGLLAFGEGWHNNHHALPDSARQGLRWWEFDISWHFIKSLEKLNLVWDIKEASYPEEAPQKVSNATH